MLVYRHATHRQRSFPLLWSGFVGGTFFVAPIILMPVLIPLYYALFIPPGPGFLVKPLHALATILGGGALVGGVTVILYIIFPAFLRRRAAQIG